MTYFMNIKNNYFTNYADDTTPHVVGDNTTEVLTNPVERNPIMINNIYVWVFMRVFQSKKTARNQSS